jgi:hypothetical protein
MGTKPAEPSTSLSEQQLARAEALDRARAVLMRREFAGTGPVDALDVYNLACFILTGEDPWESMTEPSDGDDGD